MIEESLAEARDRFGLRVIEFSVLGDHLHPLLVEADSKEALSRGMKGLCVRLAKALNTVMSRRGSVFADHYHSRVLGSPTEVVKALAYVLGNAKHHYGQEGPDRFSSSSYDPPRGGAASRSAELASSVGWRKAPHIPECLLARAAAMVRP